MRKIDNIHIKNLINDLKKEDISFSFDGETTKKIRNGKVLSLRLENVTFTKNDNIYKVCEPIFFREYGPTMDDITFYNYQKSLITKYLK